MSPAPLFALALSFIAEPTVQAAEYAFYNRCPSDDRSNDAAPLVVATAGIARTMPAFIALDAAITEKQLRLFARFASFTAFALRLTLSSTKLPVEQPQFFAQFEQLTHVTLGTANDEMMIPSST